MTEEIIVEYAEQMKNTKNPAQESAANVNAKLSIMYFFMSF